MHDCECIECEGGCDYFAPADQPDCDDCEMGNHRPERED